MTARAIRELIELQELGTEAFQQIIIFVREGYKEWVSLLWYIEDLKIYNIHFICASCFIKISTLHNHMFTILV